jgi:hypothetical protein
MQSAARSILLSVVATLLCSCTSYSGDGKFSDGGWSKPHERYRINLGSVDLSHSGHATFKMSGLPSEEFIVGLTGIASCLDAAGKQPLRIRMSLHLSDGTLVFSDETPLQEWTPSSGFWYRRGKQQAVPVGDGVTRYDRIGVGAHGGWAPTFLLAPFSTYTLTLDAIDPKSAASCEAGVDAIGGGWD